MEDKQKTPEYEEHNASLDPDDDPIEALTESELQDRILEDSNMSAFQKFFARMDDAKWKLSQRIFGVFLGLAASVALFWPGQEGRGGSYSLVIAVVIALLIPNLIEKRLGRKITHARMVMAITLGIAIVAFFIMTGVKYGFNFVQK